jgi:hypothetical protein
MTGDQRPPELSADRWIAISKIAAALSLLLFGVSVAVLSFGDPPTRCPAWHLPDRVSTSLWVMIWVWSLPLAVISCVVATFWQKIAHAALDDEGRPVSILFGLITVRCQFPGPVTHLIVNMCVVPAAMSNLPLGLIVLQCGWPFL